MRFARSTRHEAQGGAATRSSKVLHPYMQRAAAGARGTGMPARLSEENPMHDNVTPLEPVGRPESGTDSAGAGMARPRRPRKRMRIPSSGGADETNQPPERNLGAVMPSQF